MEASVSKTVTDEDITAFAEVSGDINPVHLNEEFAAGTIFKKRIAHGFMTGSLFSTVLGTKLPGPGCVYISQTMNFRGPVFIGDELIATCKITDVNLEKARVTFDCVCTANGRPVLMGEALMMVSRRPSEEE